MKTLLAFVMIFSFNTLSKAGELDNIALITPVPYGGVEVVRSQLEASLAEAIKNTFSTGIGLLDLSGGIDFGTKIKNKLAPKKAELLKYFKKPGEFDFIVNALIAEAERDIINQKENTGSNYLDNNKVIKLYRFSGQKLAVKIADKILEVKGIDDPIRRKLWTDKITSRFNICINNRTNTPIEAAHCMNALIESLPPSLGIGVVFELSRSRLNSALPEEEREAFNISQVNIYKACLKETAIANNIENCALQAMRAGVLKVTEPKLSAIITESASSPSSAEEIKKKVLNSFNLCTQKIGSKQNEKIELSEQFTECIDKLVHDTGVKLVPESISSNPKVKSNFSEVEIEKLKIDNVKNFEKCFAGIKKTNIRKDGILDTAKCQNSITNEITNQIVVKKLAQTAKEFFKKDRGMEIKVANYGKRALNQCWNNDLSDEAKNLCLRKTILSFSQFVATAKLDKIIPDETISKNELIRSSLKDLSSCLEKNLPSNIIEVNNLSDHTSMCSDKLTLETASSLLRLSAEGKISPDETEELVTKLVTQKLSTCLGKKPSDLKSDECIGDLNKTATRTIVLAYEKAQLKKELNADFTPAKLKPFEDAFVACTSKEYPSEEISNKLNECTKNFALNFARTLGDLKLNTLLKSLLGTQEYIVQKQSIDNILKNYNKCLDGLKKFSMKDKLLDKLSFCTSGLLNSGLSFVSNTSMNWMSTNEKDAATIRIKKEFSDILPCLGGFLPSLPYNDNLQSNVDPILKVAFKLLGQCIDDSPDIFKKFASDLKDAVKDSSSRVKLIDALASNGALEEFLKSFIRGIATTNFNAIPESEIPKDLKNSILNKENFDKIFASPEGKSIKEMVVEKILKPFLLDKADLKSPQIVASKQEIEDRVLKILTESPYFGDKLTEDNVQKGIDNTVPPGIKRFFVEIFKGKGALKWNNLKETSSGRIAQAYIRWNILYPKLKKVVRTEEEEKKYADEAKRLINLAVKDYKQKL